jgi:mycothiol synthase
MSRAAAPPVDGLTSRLYREGDAAAVTQLITRGDVADQVPWRVSVEEVESWLSRRNENFDPTRDLRLFEVDGRPVAYWQVEWVDTTDGEREYRIGCAVDPDWRGRGIGSWMLAEAEAFARERARALPSDRPHLFGNWQPDTARPAIRLVERYGYKPVRYFFDMVRPTLDGIVEFPIPEGLELRPVTDDQVLQLWNADVEAFQDHWGGFDGSPDRLDEWKRDPKWDPSLFVVAWDGDEIAGGVFNEINATENEAFDRKRGWLASVFVRRPWRRRGLGRALVARSLVVFRERGMTSAGLGVDAANPTGALRLYEEAGFEPEFRSTAYRKPME